MRTLMVILGGICLVYYVLLLAVRMDFSVVWLAAGLVFLGGGIWGHLLPGWVKIILAVAFLAGLLLFGYMEYLIIQGMTAEEPQNPAYLIVLGAQVKGEEPSRALKKRLLKAKDFLEKNPRTIAVLSGGQGPGEKITEAEAMRRFLTEGGIPKDRLILEDRSTSTQENLLFSGEQIKDKTVPIGILTNNFHVYRAMELAKAQGYTDIYGISAPSDPVYQVHYLVREFFALVKEKMKGNIGT